METSNNISAIQNYKNNAVDSSVKTLANGDKEIYGVKVSSYASKTEQQASVVSHLFSDKTTIDFDSMKLTYQAAISKLNELLNPEGSNPVITQEQLNEKGIEYWSVQNTANRIIKGSSSFLTGFQKIHPELEGEALMDKFNEVVGGGLKQGFNEAKDILSELKIFNGSIEENFNSTYELVEKGMLNFRNEYLGINDKAAENIT